MDSNVPPPENTPPTYGGLPPVINRPPPIITPPQSSRPRRGNGWRTFAIIVVVLLVFSMLLNLRHIARSLRGGGGRSESGPRMEEAIVQDNDSANKIAVVPIEGVISGGDATDGSDNNNMVALVKAQLKLAGKD